ncbi:hypothetical protein FHL15_000554 [Xylaria flabelliformis]|uniref:Uncharacterized protein n=1 Tax=Xylaria flabelliformis TaxID=2512241 RepID=A0A553IE54_9PEZI|nr:hypothetical protein FHL15_000554 [Xylaria flabelliformis]
MKILFRLDGLDEVLFLVGNRICDTGGIEPPTLDSRGIEPRTTPMLREYYTTKPQARGCMLQLFANGSLDCHNSGSKLYANHSRNGQDIIYRGTAAYLTSGSDLIAPLKDIRSPFKAITTAFDKISIVVIAMNRTGFEITSSIHK